MTSNSIARLKITLDDVKPAVLRRQEVPLTIRLDRLHLVLQAAMGWTNSHLYEIRPAASAGAGLIRTSATDGSTPAKPGSSTRWRTSAPDRSNTSTTSATAG